MPSIMITADSLPGPRKQTRCLCEVRVDDLIAAELGPYDDLTQAQLALAHSPYPAQLLDAEFVILGADDRQFICVFEAAGLLLLREWERDRNSEH